MYRIVDENNTKIKTINLSSLTLEKTDVVLAKNEYGDILLLGRGSYNDDVSCHDKNCDKYMFKWYILKCENENGATVLFGNNISVEIYCHNIYEAIRYALNMEWDVIVVKHGESLAEALRLLEQ